MSKDAKKPDLRALARAVAEREAGKRQVDIAQISETLKHTLDLLAEQWRENTRGVIALLESRGV